MNTATRLPSREARKSLLGDDRHFHHLPGGYHERQGYIPNHQTALAAPSKMYRPNSLWTWMFTTVALVQALIVLAFEGYVFGKFQSSLDPDAPKELPELTVYKRTVPTYLTLFIFGMIYQNILVWDALRLSNTIQIIGICIYNLGLLIYAAVQQDQIDRSIRNLAEKNQFVPGTELWKDIRPYLTVVPCVLALGFVLLSIIAWKLYGEFAWSIYKHISADLRMKKRFLTYQIYIALLKFDFFFFLGFTVQFVVIVVNDFTDSETSLTIAAIPITILILIMAAWVTRKENVFGMFTIILLYFAALAYFIFKLVRIFQPRKQARFNYTPARRPLATFAVIVIVLIFLTITNACFCTANFGKGLKKHINKGGMNEEETKLDMDDFAQPNHQHGQAPSRMTID